MNEVELTRRRLLQLGVALPVPFVLAACGGGSDEATSTTTKSTTEATTTSGATTLAPTPACDDEDDPTPEQTEGPFFIPDSPERRSLRESGIDGTPFLLTGTVLATDCTPISRALLDFWHADDSGEYDNEGFKLRGHQFTDSSGRYRLETIVPGLYTGRTRHIHVKGQREGGVVLTTQLYFPDEPGNESDGIFDPALLMSVPASGRARFDFVLV